MSLINEALKRTRDASYQVATPRPVSAEPYRMSPTSSRRRAVGALGLAVGFGGFLAAVILAGAVYYRLKPAPLVTEPPVVQTVAPPAPVVDEERLLALAVEKLKAEQAAAPAPVPAPPPPAPAPEPPKLTLQGITVDSQGREALINGVNLRVGEEIDGAVVQAIEARLVKLEFAGKEMILRLP
jgi:hypothetical protein